MNRRLIFLLVFLAFLISVGLIVFPPHFPITLIRELEPIKKSDRILILAPHPDDETICCAGIIQEALKVGASVQVVYLTNGDHNEVAFIVYEKRLTFRRGEFIHMGEVRKKEAINAMKLLGLDEKDLIFLGYPDFGTLRIFKDYWLPEKPFRDILTRISHVPYKENFSYGKPYVGESILEDLEKIIKEYKPNKIFVSHPADVNVDHKALYLFLEVALGNLHKEIRRPKIIPYLVHCIGWPTPRHYHPELNLSPPKKFLDSQIQWAKFTLTPEQLNKKYQAVLCYKSQTQSSAFYLLAFARQNELFGGYPDIELTSTIDKTLSFFSFLNSPNVETLDSIEDSEDNQGEVRYAVQDEFLLVRIDKPKELSRRFIVTLYIFGYNYKTPFALMPKIFIVTKYNKFRVFDGQKQIIDTKGMSLELKPKELILKIPLKILGEPDFILTSLKSYSDNLSVDTTSFRKINIRCPQFRLHF